MFKVIHRGTISENSRDVGRESRETLDKTEAPRAGFGWFGREEDRCPAYRARRLSSFMTERDPFSGEMVPRRMDV